MADQEPTLETEVLERWIGNSESKTDTIDPRPANFLRATLNYDGTPLAAGDPLPLGYHWLYFLEAPALDALGQDGHAALGDFLPPVALSRRMWAGSRIKYHAPVRIGEHLVKDSVVSSIVRKSGRSGELCFVTVTHRISCDGEPRLEEEHDIVYRGEAPPETNGSAPVAPADSDAFRTVNPTATLLFRYSALTFNGHRIHYDADYCRDVEGYPGLVVHAPLTATLMLDFAWEYRHQSQKSVSFSGFRQKSISPLYHLDPFTIHLRDDGNSWEMWAANPDGNLAATGTVVLA